MQCMTVVGVGWIVSVAVFSSLAVKVVYDCCRSWLDRECRNGLQPGSESGV